MGNGLRLPMSPAPAPKSTRVSGVKTRAPSIILFICDRSRGHAAAVPARPLLREEGT
jgi:hypothetical protein